MDKLDVLLAQQVTQVSDVKGKLLHKLSTRYSINAGQLVVI